MQGLILAAGMGKRLGDYTQDIPKVLVEVNGCPLILQALERLYEQGVEETFIVVGYKKELIMERCGAAYKSMKITYVENDLYETTNNVYSFHLAAQLVTQDLLMVEGDLMFSKKIPDAALAEKRDCNIVVSRYNKKTMNGTVIEAEGTVAKALVTKSKQGPEYDYEKAWKTVNIYYFGQEFFTKKLAPYVALYVATGNLNHYYELVLGSLIYYEDDDIRIVPVEEALWYEIDDENDLMIARSFGGF